MQRFWFLAVLVMTSSVLAQTNARVIWEPPNWDFPQDTKATVPREMLSTLRISTVAITLEKTRLDKVVHLLGGATGAEGDAGDAVRWLCLHGADGGDPWVLWLESGEINGGYIGSFEWRRLSGDAKIDRRCHALSGIAKPKLSLPLTLGMAEADVLKVLGKPSARRGERLIYLHQREWSVNGVPYDSSNIIILRVHTGEVVSIAVSKTTSS
jgi:hypothetical protein